VDARGGTEMLAPLHQGLKLLESGRRDRVLVLVTDGQVGNEDQILAAIAPLIGTTRLHTIGIDRAVNAGFLGRLAAYGAGRCELVESEDRLDEAMEQIHRRIGSPVVTDLVVAADGLTLLDDSRSPSRLPGLYPGVPLVVSGRYRGAETGTITVTGRHRDDSEFRVSVPVSVRRDPAVVAQWARARLRDLEDRYSAGDHALEPVIVRTSLRFGVLCRFTAYVAVDSRVVNEDGETRRVTQPVELPSGWELPEGAPSPGAPMPPRDMTRVSLAAAFPQPSPPPNQPLMPPPAPFAPPMATDSLGAAPAPGSARAASRKMQTFAAVPSGVAASGRMKRAVMPSSSGVTVADVRKIAAVEAGRLRSSAELPVYERRDMLADLASRLGVLLDGQTDPEFAPLTALVGVLTSERGLQERWDEAVAVLEAFGEAARKSFWKR
jgi:Ca-activated chloride channel family protein